MKNKKNENIDEDIVRITKGYRPRSDKFYYWILYDLVSLFNLIKLIIFKKIKR